MTTLKAATAGSIGLVEGAIVATGFVAAGAVVLGAVVLGAVVLGAVVLGAAADVDAVVGAVVAGAVVLDRSVVGAVVATATSCAASVGAGCVAASGAVVACSVATGGSRATAEQQKALPTKIVITAKRMDALVEFAGQLVSYKYSPGRQKINADVSMECKGSLARVAIRARKAGR